MVQSSPDFTLDVEGVKGVCPAGEAYAKRMTAEKKIPVFSCEGGLYPRRDRQARCQFGGAASSFVCPRVPRGDLSRAPLIDGALG
jgi:hypothetical protein